MDFAAEKASPLAWEYSCQFAREAVFAAVVLWILVVAFWRYSSLGSLIAAAAFPVLVYLFYAPRHAPPGYVTQGTILISLLVLGKHRSNIERLIAGRRTALEISEILRSLPVGPESENRRATHSQMYRG